MSSILSPIPERTIESGIYHMSCTEGMDWILQNGIEVDHIITDPPYVKEEWEQAYTSLAEISEVIRPSGFLVTYSGHFALDKVMEILGKRLEWYWLLTQVNNGPRVLIHGTGMIACFKPILVYQKAPKKRRNCIGNDLITGGHVEKRYHMWQQSLNESLYLVENFSLPNELILDPFMGSGTVPLAAKLLGRRYLGFDRDRAAYEISKKRLEQNTLPMEVLA